MSKDSGEPCVHHEQCRTGFCRGNVCMPPEKFKPCRPGSGFNCPQGQVCNTSTHHCLSPQFKYTGRCKFGNQCLWGSYCNDGKCEKKRSPGSSCSNNSECAWTAVCDDGKCFEKCLSDSECGGGKVCGGSVGGTRYCEKKPEPAKKPEPEKKPDPAPEKPVTKPKKDNKSKKKDILTPAPLKPPTPSPLSPGSQTILKPNNASQVNIKQGHAIKQPWYTETQNILLMILGGAVLVVFLLVLIVLVRRKRRRGAQTGSNVDPMKPSSPTFDAFAYATQQQQQQYYQPAEAPPAYDEPGASGGQQYQPDSKLGPDSKI